jgi:hypothetical protein
MTPIGTLGSPAEAINATPLAADLWAGIAGHFDSVTQVICEFVDNSLSNFQAGQALQRSVLIDVDPLPSGEIKIKIEDTGSGIANLTPTMKLGDKTVRETPLNEHGFGLKHALASANPTNDSWQIWTRTKDEVKVGVFRHLPAAYDFHMSSTLLEIGRTPWPGSFNGSGTIVEFTCSPTFFNTIQRGIRGQAGFVRCLEYLTEELGFIYSGVISQGNTISVRSETHSFNKTVAAVLPDWAGYYEPTSGAVKLDLGGGELTVEYKFGEMNESQYAKYYKRNQSTSGVEIRINGRLMMYNLFKDIWGLENHPTFNHFLVTINLVSADRDALPKTRTSKNGIRSGDPKLEKLFDWIKKTHPSPHKDLANAQSEKELVKQLCELKKIHTRSPEKHIEMEFKVFKSLDSPVSVDLYVFDGSSVVLYEAKKDTADIQAVYQLLMYWDGAIEDSITPTEGILIASSFSPGVEGMLRFFNGTTDRRGNRYNFSTRTWQSESVRYPD